MGKRSERIATGAALTGFAMTAGPSAGQVGEGGPLLDELRALRSEVKALAGRPEPAGAADLERLRADVERLVAAQRAIVRRLDEQGLPAVVHQTPTAAAGTTPLLLIVGGLLGWVAGRIFQRRGDRRSKLRL